MLFARRSMPQTVMPAIKNAVYEAGSDQPVYNIHTMQELVSRSMGRQRFPMLLLVAFAALALLLAFRWNLRRDFLLDYPARARDWDSHGARRGKVETFYEW